MTGKCIKVVNFLVYHCMIKIFMGEEGVADGEGVAVKDA